jgi:CHAD domain-containing protein
VPYRLQKEESLAAGLKRIAEEQLAGAISELQSPQDLGEGIYQARRYLKKARSVLRLLSHPLGPLYVEENRRLRDVARRFAQLRDTQVSLELLEELAQQYKRKSTLNPQRSALSAKQSELRQATDWQIVLTESIGALNATRKRIEDWPLRTLTEPMLASEVRKTHKQSRQAFERASKTRTAQDLHEFRKTVKRELNQARLLESGAPLDQLKHLSDLLGDHHNLAVLLLNVENSSKRFRAMVQRQLWNFESRIIGTAAQIYEPKLLKPSAAVA